MNDSGSSNRRPFTFNTQIELTENTNVVADNSSIAGVVACQYGDTKSHGLEYGTTHSLAYLCGE